jgi:hypothetical protein
LAATPKDIHSLVAAEEHPKCLGKAHIVVNDQNVQRRRAEVANRQVGEFRGSLIYGAWPNQLVHDRRFDPRINGPPDAQMHHDIASFLTRRYAIGLTNLDVSITDAPHGKARAREMRAQIVNQRQVS